MSPLHRHWTLPGPRQVDLEALRSEGAELAVWNALALRLVQNRLLPLHSTMLKMDLG